MNIYICMLSSVPLKIERERCNALACPKFSARTAIHVPEIVQRYSAADVTFESRLAMVDQTIARRSDCA